MILMHRDTPVADVAVANGKIHKLLKVYNESELPVGCAGFLAERMLQNWQNMRTIPEDRQGKERIEQVLGCSVSEALLKSFSVSLTDTYWLKEAEMPICWKDVNFHDNGFSIDLARSILGDMDGQLLHFNTPDLTTDGTLKKTWLSIDGMPTLLKYGNFGDQANGKNLLSANEVIASQVANLMEIPHVPYTKLEVLGESICACPSFVQDAHTDFVNGLQLLHLCRTNLFVSLCRMGYEEEISRMIVFDHLLHNTDRHEKNFGILMDLDTGKESFAPLFDSGSCLGWNSAFWKSEDTKPFARRREEQFVLVQKKYMEVPTEAEVQIIIRDVYEDFGIEHVQVAFQEVRKSYEMLLEKEKTYAISFER